MSEEPIAHNRWVGCSLANVISLEYGASLSDKVRSTGSVPVFGSNGRVGWHNRSLVEGPGIVVGRKGSVGKLAWSDIPFWPIDTAYFVRPKNPETNWRWLFWILDHVDLTRLNAATGVPGLNRNDAYSERISLPPPSEQTRIAEILDTLDGAIREAEGVIGKLRQVKAGLLHDLLTCGLDENGQLRDPLRHPDQFQPSPLGLIPKAWKFTTLGQVLRECGGSMQTGPFGSQLHSSDYSEEGIAVIMPQDIGDDGEMNTVAAAKITTDRARSLSRHRIRLGDLIFARRGDLSRCGVARSQAVGLCGTGCLLYRPSAKSLHPEWFATVYRHEFVQKQIAAKAVGTTMVNLNTGLLTSLEITVPDWDEQIEIVDRIGSFSAKIRAEEETLEKLQSLKRGLSHDLLTGRVRVIGKK